MVRSAPISFIIFTNELGTAWGSAFGWGAQVSTTFGFGVFFCSSMVMASARAWSGWAVALSILITGTEACFAKLFSRISL